MDQARSKLPISLPAQDLLAAEAIREARRRRRREQRAERELEKYRAFQEKYFLDPAGFVRDCIYWKPGRGPAPYQLNILEEMISHRRECVRGTHGLGKTADASWAVHWFALTRDGRDWKIPTTASSWQQLIKFLWPEIHKWARQLRWDVIGRPPYDERRELLMRHLHLQTGEAFALASDKPELIEGAHADHLLFIYDEAKSIKDETFDATEGALAAAGGGEQEAYALAISTPGAPMGRFYDIHTQKPGYEDWHVRHVTKKEVIEAGRITEAWAEQRKRQWGATSAIYLNRVEGEFASGDIDSVIPLHLVELAVDRWHAWESDGFPGIFTGVGCDVGGGGEDADKTTLALCFDYLKIQAIVTLGDLSKQTATMQTANRIIQLLTAHNGGVAAIDAIGIGAGVFHRVIEKGLDAIPFVASAKTDLRDRAGIYGFTNWRSAGWWLLRELLEPESGFYVCLPPDEDLAGELTTPTYKEIGGKYSVEDKVSLKKRLGRSTDLADAVIHILLGPVLYRASIEETEIVYDPSQIGPDY